MNIIANYLEFRLSVGGVVDVHYYEWMNCSECWTDAVSTLNELRRAIWVCGASVKVLSAGKKIIKIFWWILSARKKLEKRRNRIFSSNYNQLFEYWNSICKCRHIVQYLFMFHNSMYKTICKYVHINEDINVRIILNLRK